MTTHTYQTNSYSKDSAQNPTTAVAVIIGLIMAVGFNILWQGLPFLAVIGMGLLGLAIELHRRHHPPEPKQGRCRMGSGAGWAGVGYVGRQSHFLRLNYVNMLCGSLGT
ncbi:MAG: hypothetical protein M5U34_40490 [Chloroflexi bacterium]|nr:hypothetical protein [Chloroflexota bacterium]